MSWKRRPEIVRLVKEMAEEFGQSPMEFVASFNCLKPAGEWEAEIARAWFAAEEAAREWCDK